jgi:hypothetical protein
LLLLVCSGFFYCTKWHRKGFLFLEVVNDIPI